ncbi:wax ester/triacylglycerol synthase family O-acyltransferase [Aquipuribacter hungaricus]|uniref:Diacylglycerol O-acyltransferase n=1 Tax=Aquipuribacter hungaricus TaxID=545624 RepID=A0ABV7WEA7_9MICO
MSDRLSALDASFLYAEEQGVPQHVGTVMVFEGPVDYPRLQRHLAGRIAFVPRYRKRVREVPGRLANPVWADDPRFELGFHVRRLALPRPGSTDQLRELVARIHPRELDRSRPLWELYVVEGLEDDRFAVITKAHQALVDGIDGLDLAQVVLDTSPDVSDAPPDAWRPSPDPTALDLVSGAVLEAAQRPAEAVHTVRRRVGDVQQAAGRVAGSLGRLAVARRAPDSPLDVELSRQRLFAVASHTLADFQAVARRHGGASTDRAPAVRPSVNDVVLAVLAGALRTWLQARGVGVSATTRVRALVPVSVRADDPDDGAVDVGGPARPGTSFRTSVDGQLVDLPVGEPNPVMRLFQVAYQMSPHREGGRAVSARDLAELAGFAPPTLHSLGVRVAGGLSRRWFNLLVTNVPGPQQPVYCAGARLAETYPVIPLSQGHALAVGVTSYDGRVFVGFTADRDALPDVADLPVYLAEALAELGQADR